MIDIINNKLTESINREKHADLNIEPIMLFSKEKSALGKLPNKNIVDKYLNTRKTQKVTSESLIRYKGQAFSVDPQYINCMVELEEEDRKLYIYYKNKLIEIYELDEYNNKINYKKEHYAKALATSYGTNIKIEEVEETAIENLKKLDLLGGIKSDI